MWVGVGDTCGWGSAFPTSEVGGGDEWGVFNESGGTKGTQLEPPKFL